MLSVKIHEAYRRVVAVCDTELIGKYFEKGKLQLNVKKEFYKGEEKTEKETIEILREAKIDDAIFNLVGKRAVDTAIKAGLIDKKGVIKIDNVPHALSLL